jgi:hypothetical protein
MSRTTLRRLFLEDHDEDAPARAKRLRPFLRADGQACGHAEDVAMLGSGVWAVTCAKGHIHRVLFNPEGELLAARRLV